MTKQLTDVQISMIIEDCGDFVGCVAEFLGEEKITCQEFLSKNYRGIFDKAMYTRAHARGC